MSDTQQFPNLPQSTWTCWQSNLVPTLQKNGCETIQFSGGNSGTLSFHHRVLFTSPEFAFTYGYDPAASVLTLTVTRKPDALPAAAIFAVAQQALYKCPQ